MSEQEDENSIESVDLGQALESNSATSLMPYGRMAGQAPGIQEVVLQNQFHQLKADGALIQFKGAHLSIEDAQIVAQRLRSDETLTSLRFDECFSSPAYTVIFDAIGDSTTLKHIIFDDSSTLNEIEISNALLRNQSLEHLALYFMMDLTFILEDSMPATIKSLVFFECDFDHQWESRLAHAIHNKTNIETIRIIHPTPTSDEATRILMAALSGLPALRKLTLSGFDFSESVQYELGSILLEFQSLETLALPRNYLTITGISSLTSFLAENQTVTRLDVSRNRIEDDGVIMLLSSAKRLDALDMSYVGMTDKGMESIGKFLSETSSLTVLSLFEFSPTCQHTSLGIQHVVAGLYHNYSLTALTIGPEHNKSLEFLLRANKAGRGNLLHHGMKLSPGLWPRILEKTQRFGSDVLFLFLREAQSFLLR